MHTNSRAWERAVQSFRVVVSPPGQVTVNHTPEEWGMPRKIGAALLAPSSLLASVLVCAGRLALSRCVFLWLASTGEDFQGQGQTFDPNCSMKQLCCVREHSISVLGEGLPKLMCLHGGPRLRLTNKTALTAATWWDTALVLPSRRGWALGISKLPAQSLVSGPAPQVAMY